MSAARYKELDSLRGFAALYVLFFHYTTHTAYSNPVLEAGVTGVDLFFIISGFVIFMSIHKVSSAKEFIVNRVARLYPTYWVCVTFTTLLILVVRNYFPIPENVSAYQYFANMTMFQHYLRAENIDGTYWTMIIEMTFYILIVCLYKLKLLRHILLVGVITFLITLVWDLYLEGHYDFLYRAVRYVFPLIAHFPLFIAGIIFYQMATTRKQRWGKYILLACCLPLQIMLYDNGGSAMNYIDRLTYGIMLAFYFLVFTLFVSQKLKFIVNRPALFFGKISFALYLIHQYMSIDVIIPILGREKNLSFWITAPLALMASVGLATLITFYIEVPAGKKIKQLF